MNKYQYLYDIKEQTKEAKNNLRDNKIICAFENITAIQEAVEKIFIEFVGEDK